MADFRTLDDVDVKGKRVLLRVDLNVPMENGRVTDATRLERVAPTITEISGKGGKVILLAHFGRPKGRDPKESLKPVASTRGKKKTIRLSSRNWPGSATSGSTTLFRRRIARTPRPKASATSCRPMPDAPCRRSSTR